MAYLTPAVLPEVRILTAYAIFSASYLVFALGKFPGLKIDRPGAAIIGAVTMVAFRILQPAEAFRFIDFATLVLLFSMMLIVGTLHLVGFFEWSAEMILLRLKPSRLLPAVIFISGVLSAFFVNDIVCLVMVPLVLSISRRLGLRPIPYLLAVATASNIGSVATITGNPQNILIGSFSRLGYRDFLWHLGPVAVIGLLLDWLVLHWVHMRGVEHGGPASARIPVPALDLVRLTKPVIVVTGVVIAFFAGVPPAMAAALGAAVLLISRTLEPRKLYDEVDWGLLVFFVGLFLIVGGAENAGIVGEFLRIAEHWNLHRLPAFTTAVALLSNVVSNVPAVMLLKSLLPNFADSHTAWLALAMASTLAGNLTITGSIANIIVVETAKPETRIGFWEYLRVGIPITLMTLIVGCAWLRWIR